MASMEYKNYQLSHVVASQLLSRSAITHYRVL